MQLRVHPLTMRVSSQKVHKKEVEKESFFAYLFLDIPFLFFWVLRFYTLPNDITITDDLD